MTVVTSTCGPLICPRSLIRPSIKGESGSVQAAVSETDFDAALEDAQLLEGGAIIAARIEQRKATVELLRQKQNTRVANPAVLYCTGQVMRHARHESCHHIQTVTFIWDMGFNILCLYLLWSG